MATKSSRVSYSIAAVLLGLGLFWLVRAGNLEPPGPPSPTMVSLEEVDLKLDALIEAHSISVFVGVTAGTTQGTAGVKALGDLCQAEFGVLYPNVRACFSEEILRTPTNRWPSLAGGPPGFWLMPLYQHSVSNDGGEQPRMTVEFSGIMATPRGMSCNGWSDPAESGLALFAQGTIAPQRPCSTALGVTCCAPRTEVQ
jgi:hypothetical protein